MRASHGSAHTKPPRTPKQNKYFDSAPTKSAETRSIILHAPSSLLEPKQEISCVFDVAMPARLCEAAARVGGKIFFATAPPGVGEFALDPGERSGVRCFRCCASVPSPSLSGVSRLVGPGAEAVHLPIWHQAE